MVCGWQQGVQGIIVRGAEMHPKTDTPEPPAPGKSASSRAHCTPAMLLDRNCDAMLCCAGGSALEPNWTPLQVDASVSST